MEPEEAVEKIKGGNPGKVSSKMTLQKAVDLGEYDPNYLSTFPEWATLSKHVQFQFIRKGLENRKRQLVLSYAEINNVLDFRLKPELKETLDNIHKQLKFLDDEFEKLSMEYFKP